MLADATITLMLGVIKPLGELITTLPAGPEYDGQTACLSFELFYEDDYLMPHREAAWTLLTERLDEAAWLCGKIQAGPGTRIRRTARAGGRRARPGSPPRSPCTCPPITRRPGRPPPRPRPSSPKNSMPPLARARELAG